MTDSTTSRSLLGIILGNCIPVLGVFYFGWDLRTIMLLYWLELPVIVVFYFAVIWLGMGPLSIAAMVVHSFMVGWVMVVSGWFIIVLTDPDRENNDDIFNMSHIFGDRWEALLCGGVGLAVMHANIFRTEGREAAKRMRLRGGHDRGEHSPAKHIIFLMIGVILGAFLVVNLQSTRPSLVAMVVVKTIFDLFDLPKKGKPAAEG